MRRSLLQPLVLAAAAAGIALPSFAQELTFWSWRNEDRAVYEDLIGKFEAANPGITVKFEAHEAANYNTILSTALAAVGIGLSASCANASPDFKCLIATAI